MTKKRKLRARVREVMLAEGKSHTAALAQVRRGAKQAPQASSPRGGSETQLAEQTPLGENFAGQSLLAVSFNDRDLRYADFSGANISHADFSGADLTGANFRGAVALRAKFCKVKCFAWGELDFARPELLSRVEAAPTHFCNANLEGADFSDADLQRADLSGANLRCASLARSSLHQSKCREANFEHADFAGAYLNQTDFVGANLANSKLMVGGYKTDFSNTNLKGTLLYNAGIKQGTFRRADLSNADLRHSDLQDCDFQEANLDGIRYSLSTKLPLVIQEPYSTNDPTDESLVRLLQPFLEGARAQQRAAAAS